MFNFFKRLFDPKSSYHNEDSKLMLQLAMDKYCYRVSAVNIIKARIESCEHFGYPERGIY